ncbi:hypothetical protein DL767_010137 [Monosporascus sp. MG133]|nr:hypothetical protein DL767_010137 [Monosporascus sp. MG133]
MWPFSTAYPEKSLEDISGRGYDYIIVGAGTAGCAVASCLSQDPNVTVLVIEKGPVQDSWAARVPLLSCDIAESLTTIHRFSEPERHCANRTMRYVSSESVGGNSRINGMLYTRGAPKIYDQWARMGHPNWNWDSVSPYFNMIEDTRPGTENLPRTKPRGVQVRRDHHPCQAYDIFPSVISELGIPVADSSEAETTSLPAYYSKFAYTIDDRGRRHSSLQSFLPRNVAIERQARCTVCTNVLVSRLDLDGQRGSVTGVYVMPASPLRRSSAHSPLCTTAETLIRARREVILCAGAIGSPQILQLSGLGPAALLNRHGILVRKDIPGVGAGLADHQAVPVCIKLPWDMTLHYLEKNIFFAIWQLLLYVVWGAGWLKSATTRSAIWLKSAHLDPETSMPGSRVSGAAVECHEEDWHQEEIPDVEVMLFAANGALEAWPGKPLFTLYTCLLRPESRGAVEILSTDPRKSPSLRLNFLSNPSDLAVARKSLRFSLRLAEEMIQAWGRQRARLFLAPNASTGRSWRDVGDDEADTFVRENIKPMYHLTSSCRMAAEADGGVVDDELRVYGFANLRIADASVFPTIPAAHTMAPTYMVAARCASFVRDAWKKIL